MSVAPIVPNWQTSLASYNNKYDPATTSYNSSLVPLLPSTAPGLIPLRPVTALNTIAPLQRFDLTRAYRGQSPLTLKQSVNALKVLATGQPSTPPRHQGLYDSVIADAKSLVGGIFHLPFAAVHEAKLLPTLPGEVAQVLGAGDNPLREVGNLATLPGLRFIPGSFLASTLLADKEHGGGQGIEGLRAHPLFTALDVLPIAEGMGKLTPAYRAQVEALMPANEARVAAREAAGYDRSTTTILQQPHGLRTGLTQRLPRAGEVPGEMGTVPNLLGRGIAREANTLRGTSIGNALAKTFLERTTPRITEQGTSYLREAVSPDTPTEMLRPNNPGGAEAIRPELDLRDMGRDFQLAHRSLPDERKAMLYDAIQDPRLPDGTPTSPELLPGLTAEERAMVRQYRDTQAAFGRHTSTTDALAPSERTGIVSIDGVNEVYDAARARRLSRAQTVEGRALEMRSARDLVHNPDTITDPATIDAKIAEVEARRAAGHLTKAEADTLTRTYNAALDEARWAKGADGTWSRLPPRPTVDQITSALAPYRRRPVVTRLIDHLQSARWAEANRDLSSLSKSEVHLLPIDFEGFKTELSRLIQRDRALTRTTPYSDRLLTRLAKSREKLEEVSTPARFQTATQNIAREAITGHVREVFSTHPDLDTLVAQAEHGVYDTLVTRDPEFAKIIRKDQAAANASWKALRDAGLDPIFVSRVSPSQARAQEFVRVTDMPTSIHAAKARMMDATPVAKDLGIAVNQQALDLLSRRASIAAMDEIATYGRSRADLVAELDPIAQARYARNPDIPYASHLDNLIKQRWAKWDPSSFTRRDGSSAFPLERAGDVYVPRAMAENIQQMFTPPLPNLTSATAPILNIFRTSVLPLALRWQLNNFISGAIIIGVNDIRAFTELPRAVKMLKAEKRALRGEADATVTAADRATLAGSPPSGLGTQPAEIRAWDHRVTADSPLHNRLAAAHNYAWGRKLADIMQQARGSRIRTEPSLFRRGVEASYDANQFVDDLVRISIGESGRKRFIARGASESLADAMTASRIRRAFQAWDEMTPIERSVVRSIVPFYSFASYATRFALRYPFDHPFRASVLNSVAKNELSDSMQGLPDYLRDMVFLGDPRANTNTKALNVAPFNPFGGVPSMFTLAGLLGQLAPQYTAVLESVGVNVQQGGPMLYPELRYDPESGRLVADPPGNFASNLLGNISPQLSGITALLGKNEGFKQLLARDPAAAGRQLLSNFGIPILFRDVNTGDQLIKSELARMTDQDNARKNALQTGDLSSLKDFPGLAAYGDQIRALEQQGVLDQFRPNPNTPSGLQYAAQIAAFGSPAPTPQAPASAA